MTILSLISWWIAWLQRQADSNGGSHANVDLIAPFAKRDRFTLPAVWRNHAPQDNRTRSEKPTQSTACRVATVPQNGREIENT
jgi:hypothetical protein